MPLRVLFVVEQHRHIYVLPSSIKKLKSEYSSFERSLFLGSIPFFVSLAQLELSLQSLISKRNRFANFTRNFRNHNYFETYSEYLPQIFIIIVDHCGKY